LKGDSIAQDFQKIIEEYVRATYGLGGEAPSASERVTSDPTRPSKAEA
jgi:hypothetical protein